MTNAMQPYQHQTPAPMHKSPVEAIAAWIVTVLTFGYMLPWAIAATRHKSNSGSIALINLLLGWTLIGWVVALIMAAGAEHAASTNSVVVVNHVTAVAATPPSPTAPAAGWYPAPSGEGQRYWDGQAWAPDAEQPRLA